MPPFSESFGRRKPYLYSSAAYVIGSLLTSEVPHAAGPFVGRFICGFASGIPSIVFAGSIEDMYPSKQRVWLLTFWSSVSTLGVCIGPIYGSYIEDVLGWYVLRTSLFFAMPIANHITQALDLPDLRHHRRRRLLPRPRHLREPPNQAPRNQASPAARRHRKGPADPQP